MRTRQMRNGTARAAAAGALLLAAAGCGGDASRTFGFTRDAPDEFQVTTRAPLSMPPALGDLPVGGGQDALAGGGPAFLARRHGAEQ